MNINEPRAQVQLARDTRDLERISMAAERLGLIRDRLEGLLSRLRGSEQSSAGSVAPVRSGYVGALEDTFDRINEIENLVTELTSHG